MMSTGEVLGYAAVVVFGCIVCVLVGLGVLGALWGLLVFNVGVWGTFIVCMWRDCHDGPWWFEEWFGRRD